MTPRDNELRCLWRNILGECFSDGVDDVVIRGVYRRSYFRVADMASSVREAVDDEAGT